MNKLLFTLVLLTLIGCGEKIVYVEVPVDGNSSSEITTGESSGTQNGNSSQSNIPDVSSSSVTSWDTTITLRITRTFVSSYRVSGLFLVDSSRLQVSTTCDSWYRDYVTIPHWDEWPTILSDWYSLNGHIHVDVSNINTREKFIQRADSLNGWYVNEGTERYKTNYCVVGNVIIQYRDIPTTGHFAGNQIMSFIVDDFHYMTDGYHWFRGDASLAQFPRLEYISAVVESPKFTYFQSITSPIDR